jgi:tetratricopeptide (TPR) repeat protein
LHKVENSHTNYIYRGQSNYRWEVCSGAARRLLKINSSYKQSDFLRYHRNLIDNAKNSIQTSSLANKKEVYDLEILAEIQHNGGATCLTDFTRNFLIALWFASCDYKKNRTQGRIVAIDLSSSENVNKIYRINKHRRTDSIESLLVKTTKTIGYRKTFKPRFWIWEPSTFNNRILKQDSIFFFSLSEFIIDNISFIEILIPFRHKEQIIKELDNYFHISAETVFQDFFGYSLEANKVDSPVSQNILNIKTCFDNAKEFLNREEYDASIQFFNESINCNGNNKECGKCKNEYYHQKLYFRGLAFIQDKKPIKALVDFNDSIFYNKQIDEYYIEAYRNKLFVLYELERYAEAIISCQKILSKIEMAKEIQDFYYILLELSIFQNEKKIFNDYLTIINDHSDLRENNGIILYEYFKILGDCIWNNQDVPDDETIFNLFSIFKKEIKVIVGNFFWDFSDLINWLKTKKDNNTLDLINLTQKFQNTQDDIIWDLYYSKNKFARTIKKSATNRIAGSASFN